jgi:sugar (pentulose or hexulose) kinase
MLADMLGVRLRPIEAADASALGAAKLGGQAIGRATGPPAGEGLGVLEPNRERSAAYERVRRRFRTACERRGWMRNG